MSECQIIGDAELYRGDCMDVMGKFNADSVDAIVTDPPYHLTTGKRGGSGVASLNENSPAGRSRVTTGFMGKAWDGGNISHDPALWAEALRVAKPGAHLLAFGGTRTFHRLACAIEDAGWEIRDCVMWVYGSGFPKSLDVSKAIDKAAGIKRETIGRYQPPGMDKPWNLRNATDQRTVPLLSSTRNNLDITAPATAAARQWQGWGTALKPAWEPIIVARKPLIGTVAENMLQHGTGALNIDASRVLVDPAVDDMLREVSRMPRASKTWEDGSGFKNETNSLTGVPVTGRWPANLIHDGSDEVVALFPDQVSGALSPANNVQPSTGWSGGSQASRVKSTFEANEGNAARFFYCAKASRSDRNDLCDDLERKPLNWSSGTQSPGTFQAEGTDRTSPNHHPTVKPTELMRYLCRLVTPPHGIVFDPFAGSGSTGVAAIADGFRFIGCEIEPEYMAIMRERLNNAQRQERLFA